MTSAKEIMDKPDFIQHDADIEQVVDELDTKENTLIVKKDEEVVGEIHEQSLLKVMIPEDRLDEEKVIGILGLSFDSRYLAETAEDIMNKHEVTASPDEEVEELAFLMDREDLRSLPVVEKNDVIGVVHEDRLIEEIK